MRIALAVTGCIGAYKAALVLRLLQEAGADVRVAMTESAQKFVAPLTFEALSGHPVVTTMWEPSLTGEIRHIALAQSVDLLLVAPATANSLAKFANGICDDFVSTLYISTTVPVLVAPAMNVEMWRHPATQENLERLRARGVHVVEPGSGYLACGMVGEGRLAEPEQIVARAVAIVRGERGGAACDMVGERVLVTAGPTREPIDPVRFITNRSSGRMGYAIAEAARDRGAAVTLVTGPVSISAPEGVEVVPVETAAEMAREAIARAEKATVVIKSAAVADYRPVTVADRKIKKHESGMTIELERTEDILAALGRVKGDRVLVGFAAETNDLVENARKKLDSKNADLIVANDVTREGAGFDGDTNIAVLVGRDGAEELPMMTKRELAGRILDAALALRRRGGGHG
jgi:phosphopantothenoylcysteine decarboxylase/phosphopantothenate--cysteine ligase